MLWWRRQLTLFHLSLQIVDRTMGWKSCSGPQGCPPETPLLSCSHCSLHYAVSCWTLRLWGKQCQKWPSLLTQCSLPGLSLCLWREVSLDGTWLQHKCLDLISEEASAWKSYILPHPLIYTRSCNSRKRKTPDQRSAWERTFSYNYH